MTPGQGLGATFDLTSDTFSVKDTYTIEELRTIMAFLRSENGCPWDKVQTHDSIKKNLLEEAYETIDAIDSGDPERVADELGDVLMQVVFHAQIASEAGEFDFNTVISNISRKLVSRHTHLFGQDQADTPEAVLNNWEKNKLKEKGFESQSQVLVDVPRSLPALQRAFKVQQKAAQVGFDWDNPEGPREKVLEELDEIRQILDETQAMLKTGNLTAEQAGQAITAEVGDLLFAVVNYARHLKAQPEIALTKTTDKFIRRFTEMEILASEDGKDLDELSLEELDDLWEAVKAGEKETQP